MEIRQRYQVWSKKLVCGFLVDGETLSLDIILYGIPDRSILLLKDVSDKIKISDITVVIREIKITDKTSDQLKKRKIRTPSNEGYISSFSGTDGSRSIVLYNQYPEYRTGGDYIWRPHHRSKNGNVCTTLNRLKLPHFFYDLEFTAGVLETYLDNPAISPHLKERAKALLNSIKEEFTKTQPSWCYDQFKMYFKGIGIYQK